MAALLAAGCSSSKSSPSASGSTTTAGGSSSSSSMAGGSSSSSSSSAPSGGQPSDVAGATQQVKDAYNKFFDNSISTATKAAMVQNAAQVQGLLTALAAAANGEKSSIQVNTVTFDSPTHANVDFAILLNGQPALPHASGDAVYDASSGNWQVSDATLCKLAGITPGVNPTVLKTAGCS
ncbi:hypothetical protein ABH926_001926 [Catenulispora sp. GP43]|uniref:hypothetical protein n=1 Tax=Catenulispora sp. GP43 TaxID=3156263 RepID=UPI0035164B98